MQTEQMQQWIDALRDECEPWELAELEDDARRADAFAQDASFGTGGIRALMGIGPNRLNRLTVARATAGLAAHLQDICYHAPQVVIAYDTRIHSREFALVAARVLASAGCNAVVFREHQPTPVLGFAVRHLGCDAGIVLTASHNPMEYNGFKVYGPTGDQATDELAHAIAAKMAEIDPFAVQMAELDVVLEGGAVAWAPEKVVDAYVQAVLAQSTGVDCSKLRVAYSPLNGTGLAPVVRVLAARDVQCVLVEAQAAADGSFPTCPKPNPEAPEAMQMVCAQALADGADLALANDPDADRIGVAVRHAGEMRLLTGDEVGLLLLDFLCEVAPRPTCPVAVSTIVSTPLLDTIAAARGVALRRTLTGFKYIGEQMDLLEEQGRADDFLCGIEESCGYLRGSYVRDKDGVVALMLACELAAWHKAQGRDLVDALEALYARYGHMVSQQVSVHTDAKAVVAALRAQLPQQLGGLAVEKVTDYATGAPMPGDPSQTLPASNVLELALADGCKVIVRPSGTEPKVKAYCFAAGTSADEARTRLDAMVSDVRGLLAL